MNINNRFDLRTCFFEHDPELGLLRRTFAEGIGTLFLMLAIVGSSTISRQLAPSPGMALVVSAFATAGALAGLIAALGHVSGGHFNPLITLLQWLAGERKPGCTLAYIAGQLLGGITGALLANALVGSGAAVAGPVQPQTTLALSELVASCGLMILVFGCSRSGLASSGPFAVAAWLMSAIVATPSTSYANPAVTISAMFACGPVRLTSRLAGIYLPAQLVGGLIALLVITVCYPRQPATASITDVEVAGRE